MQTVPWIVILSVLCGVLLAALAWTLKPARKPVAKPLPTEWALTARPVFSTDERRVYRLLREALPHHIVLSKLPLVRFCQPNDPNEVRYWYDLLGAHHVAFAVCSANGRVLAAIDLDTDRNNSRRVLQIKQSVLAACRVRYLRCPVDNPPTVAELQLLVPQNGSAPRAPLPAAAPRPANIVSARDTLATTVAHRRAERTALWQDSGFFQDSFFAPDSRGDSGNTEFGAPQGESPRRHAPAAPPRDDDVGGIVVDSPRA